jgi:hypothetical protein
VVHAFNPQTWEVEAGTLWVRDHPGLQSETKLPRQAKLHRKTLTQKKKKSFAVVFIGLKVIFTPELSVFATKKVQQEEKIYNFNISCFIFITFAFPLKSYYILDVL